MSKTFKPVELYGDNVAIMKVASSGLAVDPTLLENSNTGVVVGVGPDVVGVKIGDEVILRPGRMFSMTPENGYYEDSIVTICKKHDLLVKTGFRNLQNENV